MHVYDFSSDWLTLRRLRLCPWTLFDHSYDGPGLLEDSHLTKIFLPRITLTVPLTCVVLMANFGVEGGSDKKTKIKSSCCPNADLK